MKEQYKTKSEMNMSEQLEFQFQKDNFEKICTIDTLREAFKSVKRNKGAPGVDGITIEKYEENLEKNLVQLKTEIMNWTYKPTPVKRVEIPKPGGKGTRLLGIPTVASYYTLFKLVYECL